MSHFVGIVVGEDVDGQLEKFSENLEVPRYVKATRLQLIAEERKSIEAYRIGTYAEFLADPAAYRAAHGKNAAHIRYLEEEFEKKLAWTDDEVYAEAVRFYVKSEIGPDGEVYSTSNPDSRWDWYEVGGRWNGYFTLKPNPTIVSDGGKPGVPCHFHRNGEKCDTCDPEKLRGKANVAFKRDVDFAAMEREAISNAEKAWEERGADPFFGFDYPKDITRDEYIRRRTMIAYVPFCFVVDGKWYEKGEMGWFGAVHDAKDPDRWYAEGKKLLDGLADDALLTAIDFHI